MKNPERHQEYDGPSFDIADFDSPSPPKTLENIRNEEKVLSIERFDDGEEIASIDKPKITGLDSYSYDEAEKAPSKVMNEDEFHSVETVSSIVDDINSLPVGARWESFGEPVSSIVDDIDSQHGGRHQKGKIHGRRRLCKGVVKDDDEEDDGFHDVGSDFSAAVADFDSPSPAKNTENKFDGGDEIRDILSNLSSKFEFLSIEKGKRPAKQLSSTSDSITKEKFNEHKPVKVSDHIDVENTSFSFASNRSDSPPPKATATRKEHIKDVKNTSFPFASNWSDSPPLKATATRKEHIEGGYKGGHVKNQERKTVSTESYIHLQKIKDDDDDDDCVVTSGQKFVQKVEGKHGKFVQKAESDDSSSVYTLADESLDSTSGKELPFSLSNPKFNFTLPSKIANMLYPHQREGLKWLWSLHCKGKGGILGDDMGLGKTMQICGFLAGLFHSKLIKRVLVVAPKTLLPHWMKELGVVNLSRMTKEYFGTCAKARHYELQYILQDKGVLLTTYDIVRNNVKAFSGDYDETEDDDATWDYMILDEICGFLAGLFHSKLIKRVLVVAPKTLLPHWMKELGVVNLSRMTKEYFGTCAKARHYELQYILQDKGVLLTTYDIVRNNVKAFSGDYDETEDDDATWDYMILDEICGFLAGLFHSKLIKRVLVVAPKTLLPHWMKELGVVNLSRMTKEYFGTCAKARHYELQYILQDKGVLLTTYDIVRNNVKAFSGDYDETEDDDATWDYMILDEGHLIKNPSTQRAKSLLAIPCAHRIIISGTPLQNNLKELWALFNFCCPELLGDKKCFKDKFESAILRGNDKNASDRDKRVGSAVAQDLRNCIQPYFLRRLKNEVFREDGDTNTAKLSKKNEIIVWLRLTSCQRQLYEAFLNSEIVLSAFDGSPLAAITILKKICDHPLLLTKRAAEDVLEGMESVLNPEDHGVAEQLAMHIADVADKYDIRENNDISCKISFIVSLLDNLIPEGHNVLIFSQTRKMLNLIQDAINAQGYKFLRIDGTTKASDRLKIVNDFQEGVGAPIFLMTSQVGGLGLTLTKADRVIVADPAWNPSTDNQSVDRAYRIGQKKDVIVYRLMTCGTVEEKIYRKQIYKGGLFRSATEQKEQIRYFSQQDLKELFSLPKQGFDVSLTQQQLHEEHDCEHKMDPSLKAHTKFLESLGIAGISHHSLLFSRTAPVPVVEEEELTRIRQSTYVGHTSLRSSHEPNVDAAQFAFNPKDVARRKHLSPKISNKLTESEIKQQINRLSQIYANKAMVARLGDNGAKIQKQITELNLELNKLHLSKTGKIETGDLDNDFNRVINL